MKRQSVFVILGLALSALIGWLVSAKAQNLPRVRLADGGEFRVLQVTYGPSPHGEHNLGRASLPVLWLWRQLPRNVQAVLRAPDPGVSCQSSGDRPALSIWWAWIDPTTEKPQLGPSGDIVMTLDAGEQLHLDAEAADPGVRQIFLIDPPRHSRRLRFHVPVNDGSVEFAISNPAYAK